MAVDSAADQCQLCKYKCINESAALNHYRARPFYKKHACFKLIKVNFMKASVSISNKDFKGFICTVDRQGLLCALACPSGQMLYI